MRRCVVCRRPVLELAGQDTLYQTYMIARLPNAEFEAVQHMANFCHIKCLAQSGWGKLLAQGTILWQQEIFGYKTVEKTNDATILRLRIPRNNDPLLIYCNDGRDITLEVRDWANRQIVDGGVLIPHTSYVVLDLTAYPLLAEKLKQKVNSGEPFPLVDLLHGLDIWEQSSDTWALNDATLTLHEAIIRDNEILLDCYYSEFIPEELTALIPNDFAN